MIIAKNSQILSVLDVVREYRKIQK